MIIKNICKKYERIITEIAKRNVKSQSNDKKLSLVIYYNKKTSNLVIKKNITVIPFTDLEHANVIYEFVNRNM